MALQMNNNLFGNQNANEKKPTAMVWLNVGMEVASPQTGEVTFVSVPMGLPIDTMDEKAITGSNEEWRQLVAAKNALLAQLKQMGNEMEPGQEEVIEGLKVQMRRRSPTEAPAADTNPLITAANSLSFAAKAKPAA